MRPFDALLSTSSNDCDVPILAPPSFEAVTGKGLSNILPVNSSNSTWTGQELALTSGQDATVPSGQEVAIALARQVESVDAGIEGIRDLLVAHSPEFQQQYQVDPSELLNLFVPDGPLTTTPGSPVGWESLLEFSESTKEALNLALGPTKSIMGPPGDGEDDE